MNTEELYEITKNGRGIRRPESIVNRRPAPIFAALGQIERIRHQLVRTCSSPSLSEELVANVVYNAFSEIAWLYELEGQYYIAVLGNAPGEKNLAYVWRDESWVLLD